MSDAMYLFYICLYVKSIFCPFSVWRSGSNTRQRVTRRLDSEHKLPVQRTDQEGFGGTIRRKLYDSLGPHLGIHVRAQLLRIVIVQCDHSLDRHVGVDVTPTFAANATHRWADATALCTVLNLLDHVVRYETSAAT